MVKGETEITHNITHSSGSDYVTDGGVHEDKTTPPPSSSTAKKERKKVAVIGSGMAGLSSAWLLSDFYEVSVFERNQTIGFDSSSTDIEIEGSNYHIDVPLRLFDEKYYKNLHQFYNKVGIQYRPGDYCQSFSSLSGSTYFRYFNWIIGKLSLPFVSIETLINPSSWPFLWDMTRLYLLANKHLADPKLKEKTFEEYLKQYGYSSRFIDTMIIPAVAAMCTCNLEEARQYPADMILIYFTQRAMGGVRRVCGGSLEVINKISQKFEHIHINTPIVEVSPHPVHSGKVSVICQNGAEFEFDHVVIATQANHAKTMLKKASEGLTKALDSFEYVKGKVTVHTDTSYMPSSRHNWANVSFFYDPLSKYSPATIWLNPVMDTLTCRQNIFQTVFPTSSIDESKVLGTANFERPLMNKKVVQGIASLRNYQGVNNIWFCGAHAIYGIPLLENAVKSSIYIAQQLGCPIPWEATSGSVHPPDPLHFSKQKTPTAKKVLSHPIIVLLFIFTCFLGLLDRWIRL